MKYAVISDVHANETALRQVLEDASARGVERIVCLGDVVGYGPLPAATVALVRAVASATACGNHDDAVSGRQSADGFIDLAGEAVQRHREALAADDLAWLKSLPYTCRFGGAVAAHGDFTAPRDFRYVDGAEEAKRNFAAVSDQLMFVGHTHVPGIWLTGRSGAVYWLEPQDFAIEPGKRYIVNPGSVGYPRESNGVCLSSYAIYDSEARTVGFRQLPFSVSSMLQRGTGARRRTPLLIAGVAVALAATVAALVHVCRPVQTRTVTVAREVDKSGELVMERKTVTLGRESRYVRANLKLDAKGDPLDLRIEFKAADGEVVGTVVDTVKISSAKRFKVPPEAISAHFTLLRQRKGSHPVIREFAPESL